MNSRMQSVCAPSSRVAGQAGASWGCAKGWLALRALSHLLCVSPSSHINLELLLCLQVVPFPSD